MILFLGHFGPLLSSSLKPNHHNQVKIIQIPDTHCIRNLRWTCLKEVRWLFSSHFWPLLKCVFIFWKQLGSSKNWLKLNRQIKVSLYKSLFLCLFYYLVNRHGWGVVYTIPLKTTGWRKKRVFPLWGAVYTTWGSGPKTSVWRHLQINTMINDVAFLPKSELESDKLLNRREKWGNSYTDSLQAFHKP